MALLQDIKKRLEAAKQQLPTASGTETQQAAQRLLSAKGGKAGTTATPQASSIGASTATEATANVLAAQQQQGALQAAGIEQQQQAQQQQADLAQESLASQKRQAEAGLRQQGLLSREAQAAGAARARTQLAANEEQKISSINNAFSQKLQNLASDRRISTDDIFSQFEQSTKDLDFRKDAAQLEQLGVEMALSNKQYLEELNSIAKIRNLQDNLAFKEEVARVTLGDGLNSLINQLGWKRSYDSDERTFKNEMAQINIDEAISIANESIRQANTQAVIQGTVTGVKAGAQAYISSKE